MPKANVVLVFGESQNDRGALRELTMALVPGAPPVQMRREPLVLIKGRGAAEAQRAAEKIARVVRADQVRFNISAVIAHEDCDAVEPSHIALSEAIETNLTNAGVPNPVPAVPGFEMEAWWYLWPSAVAAVCSKWRQLSRNGQSVGLIVDAKRQLQRDLRPSGRDARAPEYEERHSVSIAQQVRIQNCVDQPTALSASFSLFAKKLRDKLI